MQKFEFNDIKFRDNPENERVDALFWSTFKFYLEYSEIKTMGDFKVENDALLIDCSNKKASRFEFLLEKGFSRLIHTINSKKAVYIHSNSGIPLFGTNEFGLVDRGTNIIEVKPITGCNLNCVYCSVDEGINNKRYDYVVEPEYIAEEFSEILKIKKYPVEANIGPQGEPLIYPKIVELVALLKEAGAEIISINTNGVRLTHKLIDDLAEAGLTRINLSLNALDQELATKIAGKTYPLKHVLSMIEYAKDKIRILLAPTIIPGMNDSEVEGLITLGKKFESEFPTIGFQNFLEYPRGRNPVKQRDWEEFFDILKKHDKSLLLKHDDTYNPFNIHKEEVYPKPFKKDNVVDAIVMLPGRYKNESVAVASGRCITVNKDLPLESKVKCRIVRDKHNIFRGSVLSFRK